MLIQTETEGVGKRRPEMVRKDMYAFQNTKLTFIWILKKNTPCESDRGLKKGDKEPVAGVCF